MTEFLENAPEFCREKIRQAAYTESSESKMKTKHISPKNSYNPFKFLAISVQCTYCIVVCEYLMILMIRLRKRVTLDLHRVFMHSKLALNLYSCLQVYMAMLTSNYLIILCHV